MQSDSQLIRHKARLKDVVDALTALVNEAEGDDDRQLDWLQLMLTEMLADVAGEMAFNKKIPENGAMLYHFLFMVQDMTSRLNRSDTLQETLGKLWNM